MRPDALHERDTRAAAGRRPGEAREAAARAEVGDRRARRAHRRELEGDQRVGDMHVDAGARIAHGRDRRGLGCDALEKRREALVGACGGSP